MCALSCGCPYIICFCHILVLILIITLNELAKAINVGLICHLHHTLLFVGEFTCHLLQYLFRISFVVKMHFISKIFWQYKTFQRQPINFLTLLSAIQCFIEFLERSLRKSASTKMFFGHRAIQMKWLHRSLLKQDALVMISE